MKDLVTIRDLVRYAVSRFNAANLVFGHGTTNAFDEAVFIVLEGLSLPIDTIDPWWDARLTAPEKKKLLRLFEARIKMRKPAVYLLNKAYIQGIPFYVDERVIVPRSFIGELLFNDLVENPEDIRSVLDLCTGSGCLAILAAHLFPNAGIDAVDLSSDALAVAKRNVKDHGLEDQIRLHKGDLFAPVKGKKYDLILTNPPYVTTQAVKNFPKEYQHEPKMAHAGGKDGMEIVRRILKEAPQYLTSKGILVCEVGSGRFVLENEYPKTPFLWLDTAESEGEVFMLAKDQV